ncbi:hypothetical protein ACFVHW_13140 [Streptomyces sp. NPDC127110]|uniref:hypothetical protein n=1 Tax=Streptomyces sp. NPDC127110 TaxID=3345362 RepID=UPI00363A4532
MPAAAEKVSRQASNWAVAAMAAALLGLATPFAPLALPTGLLVVLPLTSRSAPARFSLVCAATGGALLVIATGLTVVAPAMDIASTGRMLLLLPTPLMLLGAAFTAPHEKPGARWLWGVLALPLGAISIGALALLAGPHVLRALLGR